MRELHEAYKDRGVEVIHLSVDRNHKFWEEVVRKHDIADPNRSFIALNLAESTFLQKLDVAFIPRYLIFDPAHLALLGFSHANSKEPVKYG